MKLNIFVVILSFATIICSCVQTKNELCTYDNEEHFISDLLKQGKLVKVDSLYSDIQYQNLPDSCISYLSKSHCSVCISNSIHFLEEYNLKKDNKVSVIISENDSAIVDYYYGNVPEISERYLLVRNVNSLYVRNNLDYYNGFIILKRGCQYDTYKYVVKY